MASVTEEVKEKSEEAKDEVEEKAGGGNNGLGKKLLIPVAAGLGTVAATYAARKAPELLQERVKPKLEEEGSEELAKVGKQAASKVQDQGGAVGAVAKVAGKLGGGGGGGDHDHKKTRRLPIQRWTDVAVPVETAYQKWTDFEKFPEFMHRVLSVEQTDPKHLKWEEKIWFSKRQWEGEITDRRKNDRIAWKTKSGTKHSGLVSFHELDDELTRVMVTVNFEPGGFFEKLASGLRFAKRAVQADLARFKAYVEMDETKGLEYSSERSGQSDEGDDEGDGEERQGRQRGSNGSQSNGQQDSEESRERARQEIESAQQERAQAREQRRKSQGGSSRRSSSSSK